MLFLCYLILIFNYFPVSNGLKCMLHSSKILSSRNIVPIQKHKEIACNSYCFSIWKYDPFDLFNISRYRLIESGCFDKDIHILNLFNCNKLQCTSSLQSLTSSNSNTSSCCCYGDRCNSFYSINVDIDDFIDSNDNFNENYKIFMSFLLLICLIFFIFTVISAKFVRSTYHNKKIINNRNITNNNTDSLNLLESQPQCVATPSSSKNDCMDNLIFLEIIDHGKYGPIWKGKVNDITVTIKVCHNAASRHLWKNECLIYSLPFMNHANFSNLFFSIEKANENGLIENYLVIEYGPYGSLQSYLVEYTFDWKRMCQLFKSLVQGIAYLHTEIRNDSKVKPSVAHCDLCSSNIIIKADGSCMICDFQNAVPFTNGVPNLPLPEDRLSNTVRYMAPEVLDGAINLWQSESSLKQTDIYALGLILWEIATRCTDLYQGIDVPKYMLPFEQEVGLTPSLDQMRLLVNRHKARPLFPDIWKDSNYAIRALKETISECWDHEPEARLTALCIEERISELPTLWKRHKMETLSSCYVLALLQEHSQKLASINSNEPKHIKDREFSLNHSTKINNKSSEDMYAKTTNNICYINKFENSLHCKYNDHNHLLHHPQHKHYFHQILSINNKKHPNSNIQFEKNFNAVNSTRNLHHHIPKLSLPLQPHHARNPCMERNLMIEENEDEHNEILEQGLKFKSNHNFVETSVTNELNETSDINSANDGDSNFTENRTLMQTPMPIPFVQNYVSTINGHGGFTGPNSVKIKDINKYRDSSQPHRSSFFFKHNLVNFLKRKFNLDFVFKSPESTSKPDYNYHHHPPHHYQHNKRITKDSSIIFDTKLLVDSNRITNNDELPLDTSSTMISLDGNDYSFSNVSDSSLSNSKVSRKQEQRITDKTESNKLNNSSNPFLCGHDNNKENEFPAANNESMVKLIID